MKDDTLLVFNFKVPHSQNYQFTPHFLNIMKINTCFNLVLYFSYICPYFFAFLIKKRNLKYISQVITYFETTIYKTYQRKLHF